MDTREEAKPALTLGILASLLGFLSFQVVFVYKYNLMKDNFLLLVWLVSGGLDLISSRYVPNSVMSNSISQDKKIWNEIMISDGDMTGYSLKLFWLGHTLSIK